MGSGVQGFQFLGPENKDVSTSTTTTGTSTDKTTNKFNQSTNLTFDPNSKEALDASLKDTTYSKEAAITDSQAAGSYAVNEALKAGMPSISAAATNSGGYNSTTKELLSNDLTAKATAAGSTVMLDTISKYAAANAERIQAATGAVSATTGKTSTGTTVGDTQRTTSDLTDVMNKYRSAGALWDTLHPNQVAGGRYGPGQGSWNNPGPALRNPGSTVICTQLYIEGFLTREEYVADNRYVRNTFNLKTAKGYRFWAVPFVRLMRKNTLAHTVGVFVGTRWSKHMAANYLPYCKKSFTGWFFLTFIAPICYIIGCFISDTDFESLWYKEV